MATLKNPTLGSVKKPTKVNMLGSTTTNSAVKKPTKVNMLGSTKVGSSATGGMKGKVYTQNRTKTSLAGYQAPAARSAQTALNKKATKKTLLNKKSGLYKEPVIR